jgi:hypothetical protein
MMEKLNHVQPSEVVNRLGHIVQEFINELHQRFPRAKYVLEEPGYGDEDVVIRVYGESDELNALSNAAAQLSAELDARYGIFLLALTSPMSDCPVNC